MLRPQNKYFIYVCNNLFLQVSFLLLPWHVPSTPSHVKASGAGETVIVNVVVVNVIVTISFITTITWDLGRSGEIVIINLLVVIIIGINTTSITTISTTRWEARRRQQRRRQSQRAPPGSSTNSATTSCPPSSPLVNTVTLKVRLRVPFIIGYRENRVSNYFWSVFERKPWSGLAPMDLLCFFA